METEKQLLGGDTDSDFEEDFAVATGQSKRDLQDADDSLDNMHSDDEDSMGSNSGSEEETDIPPAKKIKKDAGPSNRQNKLEIASSDCDSQGGSDMDDDELLDAPSGENDDSDLSDTEIGSMNDETSEVENLSDGADNKNKSENGDGTWEDIYGRKRDNDGNIVSNVGKKYVPPGARLKQLEADSSSDEKLSRLRKQLKGYLNRLAEHNMHTIAAQVCKRKSTKQHIFFLSAKFAIFFFFHF